jgi:Fe-S-cluster containining protein
MATLASDPERERRAAARACGSCSLCCTILRVDELGKRAGVDCIHQRRGPGVLAGCAIHEMRPPICRGYRCLWLQGGLEDDERPDRTGGIVDLEATGAGVRLAIRESRRGAFDESPPLQAIAERYRDQMPVRISDAEDVMNPDRPFRVLLAEGLEQRVEGERLEIFRDGLLVETRRLPWAERWARRLANAWRAKRLARISARRE